MLVSEDCDADSSGPLQFLVRENIWDTNQKQINIWLKQYQIIKNNFQRTYMGPQRDTQWTKPLPCLIQVINLISYGYSTTASMCDWFCVCTQCVSYSFTQHDSYLFKIASGMFLLCALRVGVLLANETKTREQKNLVCHNSIILSQTFHN